MKTIAIEPADGVLRLPKEARRQFATEAETVQAEKGKVMKKPMVVLGGLVVAICSMLLAGCAASGKVPDGRGGVDPGADYVSVRRCGARGDGRTDDTAAVQAALDAGKNVYFPSGQYLITRSLRIRNSGQTLFSHGRNQHAERPATSTIRVPKDIAGPVFWVDAHKVMFLGLSMCGPGKSSKTTAILYQKTQNSDDVDGMVLGCAIKQFGVGIRIVGRGLRVERSIFASITEVVSIDWPSENLAGEGLQRMPYGMRAFFFFNNRVHTCSTFVVNEGPEARHLWGLSLTGNLLDIGDALFRGAATYSNISGNTICHTRRTPILFRELCHSTVIANNVISGGDSPDGKRPAYGLWFEGACHDVTINANVFANIRNAGILFAADTQEHIIVNANVFNQVGLDKPATRSVLQFSRPATNIVITANSFRPGPDGAPVIVAAPAGGLTGVAMTANVCEAGKMLRRDTSEDASDGQKN